VTRRSPSRVDVPVRMLRAARHLYEGGVVSTEWFRGEFGVSRASAKRDMQLVVLHLPIEVKRVGPRGRVARIAWGRG
jgi:predicted DNA-binding transcriptional regulator YafY